MKKENFPPRWLAIALCLCMALGMLPLSGMAFAAERTCPNHQTHDASCVHTCKLSQVDKSGLPPGVQSSTPKNGGIAADIAWYDPAHPQSSYEIRSAAQLAGLAQLVNEGNAFPNTTFKLSANIDLNNEEWTPIGKGYMNWIDGEVSLGFAGIFDGRGHTISGLSVTVNSAASDDGYIFGGAALFGYVLGGTVKNLTVRGAVNVQNYGTNASHMGNNAGVVGFCAGGTVKNCVNYATITGHNTGGGIVGYLDSGTVTKCTNYGNISLSKSNAAIGGIAGFVVNSRISLCHNAGNVTYVDSIKGGANTGGIVGAGDGMEGVYSTVQSCYNSGTITMNYPYGGSGGIGGFVHHIHIIDCYNSGTVANSGKPTLCGGISGTATTNSSMTNCYYLNTSCLQGYGSDSEVAPKNAEIVSKTAGELNDPAILGALNKTNAVWGFAKGIDYPAFLFTIPANYSAVEEALAKVPDDLSLYTNATAKAVTDAVDAVILNKMADEQAAVDAMAKAIEDAIDGLTKKEKIEVISGGNKTVKPGEDYRVTFTGEYRNWKAVWLNGVEMGIHPTSESSAWLSYPGYNGQAGQSEAGSVKIILFKEFLATLSAGEYTLEIEFENDGEKTAGFTAFTLETKSPVPQPTKPGRENLQTNDIPQTGDTMPLWPWLVLTLAALTGGGALLLGRRKKEHK